MAPSPLDRVLAAQPPPFAIMHRPAAAGLGTLDILTGETSVHARLADVPLPAAHAGEPHAGESLHQVLLCVPYRLVAERGFAAVDDGCPLIAMTVTGQQTVPAGEALARIPHVPIRLSNGHFDLDDDSYANLVRRVVSEEIGAGEGANFVIKRSFTADIADYTRKSALSFFRRLLQQENGAYWTFIVYTGSHTFVGATPERHISLRDGTAVMNPISGTYRYPPSGPTLPGIMEFLADRKEADELYMVVDEELKMMSRICESGGRVTGPFLKEMARLAHTEYFIEGSSVQDPRTIVRETMFAPTVTGSPLESACRVIAKYEPRGRGYYGGIMALIGADAAGARTLDSAILIRTADIDHRGHVEIGVGATLVRHSDPACEAAETRAKAAGLLGALGADDPVRLAEHPSVRTALGQRNATVSGFWLSREEGRGRPDPALADRRVLVIDAEDTFTAMLGHQLRSLGLSVTITRFDESYAFDAYDAVVMGPGPGDPRQADQPKIARLRAAIGMLLAQRRPFLAVCLSHQVLSSYLGFSLVRREVPNQGVQREIDLFGTRERVGFYNTFAAHSADDKTYCDAVGVIEVCRDASTGEVHALRGPGFASLQFHAESLLTRDGVAIIATAMKGILDIEAA